MKKELRERVWLKYHKHCAYCGKILAYKDMQVDHLTPQNRAWAKNYVNLFDNLMPSCRRCNHYKRAYTLDHFRFLMSTLHDRVNKQYITKVAIDYGIVTINPFSGVFYFEKCENFTVLKEMP